MPQNKNKKVRNTADLIVCHAERHLVKHPHLRLLVQLSHFTGTAIFTIAGVCVMLTAFYIVNSAGADPAFSAENAANYSSQQNFYSNGDGEMHAAANEFAAVKVKIHEAARAAELSRALNFIGLFLILGGFWYFHKKHGIFGHNRVGFTIRKIR